MNTFWSWLFQSPLLGAVPSPTVSGNYWDCPLRFNPLFWGQCLHRSVSADAANVQVSIPSSGGSAFTAGGARLPVWGDDLFQSPLLGAVPSPVLNM